MGSIVGLQAGRQDLCYFVLYCCISPFGTILTDQPINVRSLLLLSVVVAVVCIALGCTIFVFLFCGRSISEIKYVSGSVEAACGLGLADAVVDLVETGTTMRVSITKKIKTGFVWFAHFVLLLCLVFL